MTHHGMSPKDFQGYLKSYRFYNGKVDGIEGPLTLDAAKRYLEKHYEAQFVGMWSPYAALAQPYTRMRLAIVQHYYAIMHWYSGKIDGLYGPATQFAVEQHQNFLRNQNLSDYVTPKTDWPAYKDMTKFYGSPGQRNILVDVPYPLRLAWDKNVVVNRITINERCADSAIACLEAVLKEYGHRDITSMGLDLFGGCFNNRRMRGGSRLSTHAVAAALDFDPMHNPLRADATTARFAHRRYNAWWSIWERAGWVSLGRERNYDWMHLQAVQL